MPIAPGFRRRHACGTSVHVHLPELFTMNLFNRLPGFVQSPPGLEHRIWQSLPAIALLGSLLPLALALVVRMLSSPDPFSSMDQKALLLWDFVMMGVLLLHWMLVLMVGLICFTVRVMKGPAYVADAYPLPDDDATW
jgi:hypothetical protein